MYSRNSRAAQRCAAAAAAALIGLLALPQPARAAFPDKPIRLVVGSNTGGGGDTTARIVADGLARQLDTSIIVDNRPGASGNIGAGLVARANPDGYTLLFAYSGHVINPALFKDMPFDTVKDFRAIGKIGDNQSVLIVNPGVPAHTAPEFVALAKKNPGHVSFGALFGTDQYMTAKVLERVEHIDLLMVPYKGNGPALTDLMSGQVNSMINTVGASAPLIRAGKVRALAVTSATRSSLLPDVPTLAEAGIEGVGGGGFYAVMAPAGVPDAVVKRLSAALQAALAQDDVDANLRKIGVEPAYVGPREFDAFIAREVPRWQTFTRDAGIKAE
jgi:tripartite-type tricarboxylate transporter receptor subunit TctC